MEVNRRIQFWQGLLFLTVLLAVLCQSFVPAGFMPDVKGGKTALVICSGLDTKTIFIDDHGQDGAPDNKHTEKPCPFAVNAMGFVMPPVFAIVIADTLVQSIDTFFRQYPFRKNYYSNAQPRGPPEKV